MSVPNPFTKYILCEQDPDRFEALKKRVERDYNHLNYELLSGDSNQNIEAVIKSIPSFKKGNTLLPFCFVDPFSLDLSFTTVAKLGKNLMDFLILQALHMDANRNFEKYMKDENQRISNYLGLENWREVFEQKNRAVVLRNIALGAEETIGIIVWPIFIFLLLDGDYFKVGALSSFIAGATVLMQFSLGHYLDRIGNKKHVLRIGSILYALGWIVKIFVVTAFQVFIAGLYHKFAKIFTDTSFDAIFYELAADQGHYIDEFTVLGEIAVQIGRVGSIVAVGVMALYMSIEWTFVIGALAALSLNALYGKIEQRV